jgi:hypothetical protein
MRIQVGHFEVPLPCGRRLLIDPTGFDKIKHLSWQTVKHPCQDKYYVHHTSRERRSDGSWHFICMPLARFLMGLKAGDPRVADHINGNPLDNRWVNLRICANPQNVCNRKLSKNNTSGFKGVVEAKNGRWVAQIAFQRKCHYLGTFSTPEEAHQAYREAAIRFHGEFANFGVGVPPPGPGIEVFLPSHIEFLRMHLPDPVRCHPIKVDAEGGMHAVPLAAGWGEYRPFFKMSLLGDSKLIYGRAFRRFRDLVTNNVVAEKDQPTVITLLTAAEVGFDQDRTIEVSRQKYPVVVQVFRNMRESGLWREWVPGGGVRWGVEFGWVPEDEKDRWRFGIEFAITVAQAKDGVAEALDQWTYGIVAARVKALEVAKRERLSRPESQPYPRPPSGLRPVRPIKKLSTMSRSGLRLFVANYSIFS